MSTTITPAKSAKFTPTILQRQPLGDSSSDPQKPTELSKVQTVEVAELVTGTKSEVVTTLGGDTTSKEHNYAAKPAVNGDPAATQKENSSSDSSSEGSSSESSSSSEGESEGEEKKGEKSEEPKPSESTTPLRRGRGRPRKYVDVYATATTSSSPVVSQGRKRTSTGRTPKTPVRMIKNSADTGEKPPSNRKRGRGCGNCPGCLRDDCGTCAYCKDKPKFGGPGKKKQRCSLRICSNFLTAPGVRNSKHPLTSPQTPAAMVESIAQKKLMAARATPKATPTSQASTPKAKAKPTPQASATKPKPSLTQVPPKVSTGATNTTAAVTTTSVTSITTPAAKIRKTDPAFDPKVKCIHCGRERKQSMARNGKFCSQRCILHWLTDHPEKTLDDAITNATPSSSSLSSLEAKQKHARELKNLHIDMALPGSTLPPPSSPGASPSPPSTTNPLSPPILAPSPKPLSSTTAITTRKPVPQHTSAAAKKETATVSSTKRPAPSQPAATKKPREDPVMVTAAPPSISTAKSVTFNLSTAATDSPVSTVQVEPLSAPPLSRTIPPPSISIVPLDQLSALGTALLSQQRKKQQQLAKQSKALGAGLPADPHSWTVEQVVHYFYSTSDCRDFAELFREQEVDGTALLLLSHESLVKCLGIKLGRALKIMVHVEELRKEYESLT